VPGTTTDVAVLDVLPAADPGPWQADTKKPRRRPTVATLRVGLEVRAETARAMGKIKLDRIERRAQDDVQGNAT